MNLREWWLIEKPSKKTLPLSRPFHQPGLRATVRTSSDLKHETDIGPARPVLPRRILKAETCRTKAGEASWHFYPHHFSLLKDEQVHDPEACLNFFILLSSEARIFEFLLCTKYNAHSVLFWSHNYMKDALVCLFWIMK